MRRLGGVVKEALNVGFRPTGDDDPKPRCLCSRIGKSCQDVWTAPMVTTFAECVNDIDKSMFRVVRKLADEVKEERVRHRL